MEAFFIFHFWICKIELTPLQCPIQHSYTFIPFRLLF
nr:MAG TPA: hypothetical protein [Caudoviricetes sp.]